ncbi:MAG: DOMON domain-containing protein [Candidatus Hodarchaeales archaeon]
MAHNKFQIGLKLEKLVLFFIIFLLLIFPVLESNLTEPKPMKNSDISSISSVKSKLFDFDTTIPRVDNSNVTIDGQISQNEYKEDSFYYDPDTEINVFWEHNGVNLTVCLDYPGNGWVSLGIGEEMEDSNMIIGGAIGDSSYSVDLIGIPGHDHVNDTEEDGLDDILDFSASENDTRSIFEFIIPFNPSDSLDPILEEYGTYPMFFGLHTSSDNIKAMHTSFTLNTLSVLLIGDLPVVDTTLTVDMPTSIQQGEDTSFIIEVTLVDELNQPLVNKSVNFIKKTVYGNLIIDVATTDENGQANITYNNPSLHSNHVFGAKFTDIITSESSFMYWTSEEYKNVEFLESESETEPAMRGIFALGLLAAFWVTGIVIWGTYSFNLYTVIKIITGRKNGSEPTQEEVSSKVDDAS